MNIPLERYQFAGILGTIMMITGILILQNVKNDLILSSIPFIMGSLLLLGYTIVYVFENNLVRFKE